MRRFNFLEAWNVLCCLVKDFFGTDPVNKDWKRGCVLAFFECSTLKIKINKTKKH
jgi:hypothetical protein